MALRIDVDRLPLAEGVAEVAAAAGRSVLELAAGGGDDYELLFTAPPDSREAVERDAGLPVVWLGGVEAGSGVAFSGSGAPGAEELRGYEHA